MYASAKLQKHLESNEVYHIALKGINTKLRYPDSVYRSMGDLDFLYRPEQSPQLARAMQELGYGGFSEGRVHDHYYLQYISVEMHRELVAEGSKFSSYYIDIWERCKPKGGFEYVYEMSLEDECIYNILHLIEHFKNGGIGIRFMMDIYVYEHLPEIGLCYVRTELDKLGVLSFYENIRLHSEWWFGTAPQIDNDKGRLLEKLGDYVIQNGVYGNAENAAALTVVQKS